MLADLISFVQILNLANLYKTNQPCSHQQHVDIFNARIVGTAFIHDEFARKPVSVDGFFENGGGRCFITVLGNHEINRGAEFINGAI